MLPKAQAMRRTLSSAFSALLAAMILVLGGAFFLSPAQASPATAQPAAVHSAVLGGSAESAAARSGNPSDLPTINASALPTEGRDTLALIAKGGPYPYKQDDQTFSNREGILPAEPSGYYREYTVKTPGASDRGARRIIAGSDGEKYYTADHYASFKYIDESK